jgi:hypothetical protein
LRHVTGIEEARAVRHVNDVVVTVYQGQRLVPLPDDSKYAGFIFARGATQAEVEQAVREANEKVRFAICD